MTAEPVDLTVLAGTFAVVRLDPREPIPEWAEGGGFVSITRTAEELSIVCAAERVPADAATERDWRCLAVAGPLDFSAVGILASLSTALAGAGVSLFAVSTYDTDYLLVRAAALETAIGALRRAGHTVLSRTSGA